jgi:hypothetical protein
MSLPVRGRGLLTPDCGSLRANLFGLLDLQPDAKNLSYGREKCFYHDCPPERNSGEIRGQLKTRLDHAEQYMRLIKCMDGWHVYEGIFKRHKGG